MARYEGDHTTAEAMFARCEAVSREAGDDLGLARSLFLRATVAHTTAQFRLFVALGHTPGQ